MLTSGDIAQQFQMQNQGFMGMQDYSQRIGMSAGGPMGLGQYGQPQQPPGLGFNYSSNGGWFSPNYGDGNRFAAGALTGLGFVKGAADISAGYLGLAGFLPNAVAHSLPFGRLATGALGMGVGAGLSGLSIAAGAAIAGGQQQYAINNAMAGYNFFNPMSRTGGGFTRQDATAVGNLTRQMAELPQMMTSMEELTRIMSRLKGTGLMQGATTATEFGGRFREAITTIRETAKILGTTMEDATNFFAHSRSVGFLGRTDQLKNALNVQFTSGMTGMTIGQVQQLQQYGADTSSRIGGRRRIGAETAGNLAQTLGAGIMSGRIRGEDILNLTGKEGPEGINAAAMQLQESMLGMALNTPTGTLLTAGMMKVNGDKAEIDQDLLRRFSTGQMSLEELKRRAGRLSDHDKMVYMNERENLAQGLAATPGGVGMFYKSLVRQHGDAGAKLLMRQQGFNPNQIDLISSMERVSSDEQFGQFSEINKFESQVREEKSPGAMLQRLKTRVKAATVGRIEGMFAESFNAIGQAIDESVDDVVGRHRVAVGKVGAERFGRILSGDTSAVSSMFASVGSWTPERLERLANSQNTSLSTLGAFLPGGKEAIDKWMGGRTLLGLTDRDKMLDQDDMLGGAKNALLYSVGKGPLTRQGVGDILDRLKGGSESLINETDQNEKLRIAAKLVAGQVTNTFGGRYTEEEIKAMEATDPGRARLIRAYHAAEAEAAKNGVKGNIAAQFVLTEQGGYNPNDNRSIDIARVRMAASREITNRNGEALGKLAFSTLKDSGLDEASVSSLKDSAGVRRHFLKAQKGDKYTLDAIHASDPAKGAAALGISENELKALQHLTLDADKNSSGWQLEVRRRGLGVLEDFDNWTVFTASKDRLAAEGRAIIGEAEGLARDDDLALRGFSKELSELGGYLSGDQMNSEEGYKAGVQKISDFINTVSNSNLSRDQKRKLASRAHGFGGGIMARVELDRMTDKKFTSRKHLAEALHLGAGGEEMLEKDGITSTGPFKLTKDMAAKLRQGVVGRTLSGLLTQEGQSVSSGESIDRRLLNTLEKSNDIQKMQLTMLSILVGKEHPKEVSEIMRKAGLESGGKK